MTNVAKISLTVAGLGTVGGGVGLGVHLLNKENPNALKFKLISEGFDTEISETEWDTILVAHNAKENTNLFKSTDGETKDKAWIKNKCYEALKDEDKDNSNYKLAVQWCVKPEAISDILGKDISKFKVLNTVDEQTEADKSSWTDMLRSLEKDDNKTKLGVGLSGSNDNEKIKEVKRKCRDINKLKTISLGFQEKFELAKQWCAISKQG